MAPGRSGILSASYVWSIRVFLSAPTAFRRGRVPTPSIWPFTKQSSSPPEPLTAKTWNFRLDDPALTTRIASMASHGCNGRFAAAGIGIEDGDSAGGHSRAYRIRARGQDDRHARPENNSGSICVCEEYQIFREHVAGLEVGNDEDLGATRDFGFDAFNLNGFGIDGVVEGERTIKDAAGYLTTVCHLA